MYKQHEMFSFIVCLIVLIFIMQNKKELKNLPNINYLLIGFYSFFGGAIANVIEGFFIYNVFNVIEHLCLGLSVFFIFLWFYTNRKLKIK